MGANKGEPQATITDSQSRNQQASVSGSHRNIPFILGSSGSYTHSKILNCTNGSNASSSPVPQSSGSYASSATLGSQIATENGISPASTLSESCKCSNNVNAVVSSLPRSLGSCTCTITANCNSTLEQYIANGNSTFLPRSSGSCTHSGNKSTTSTHSGNKSTTSTLGILCRICHDGESEEKLVSPCLCAGTQGLIHKTCLERWLSTASYDSCEICHFPFHLRKRPKSFFEFLCHKWEPDMRRAVAGDLLCFLVLTPLTLVSAYLCGRGAIQYFTDTDYYDNRDRGDHDRSIFSSSFSKRYRDRQIPRERISDTSLGTTYERGNFYEIGNKFNASDDYEAQPLYMEASGLIILAIMLVIIYSCWLAIAVRYHVKAFRRWQRVHQDLVLVDVSNPGPICRLNLSFMSNNSPPNRNEYSQIYTLPESSYVDLDEQRVQRLSLVPEVHNESRRSSIFSQLNISVGDSGWRMNIFRGRTGSECVRKLSESEKRSSLSVSRRASEGGRRPSIFSACLNRENSPTRCTKYEELSGKTLLHTSKKGSIKKYAAVNSLNESPSKKYFDIEYSHIYNENKSPPKKGNGSIQLASKDTETYKTDTNIMPTKEKPKASVSPVTSEVSIPIECEDYDTPESYRIACAMYVESMYNREVTQMTSPEHFVGIHKFPFSPTRFNYNRNSSKTTNL